MAVVFGLHDLQAAFADADRQLRLGIRGELRQIAEPVRAGAEQLAMSTMRNMPRSPRWSKMRIGVTRDLVYVAPRQRGFKGRGYDPRRRGEGYAHPPFSDLLMLRAMEPALEQHTAEVEAGFDDLLGRVTSGFNGGA
jgi:hypothetical protein